MAAVDYGADAVYIGGSKFGARRGACNPVEEVARAVEYAHQYGVRIHATLNTLLFDGELADAEAEARALIAAGVDALIVQDMALRRMELPVELHASTQMCNMTPEQARFLGDCGFARVILERALSLEEIRAVAAARRPTWSVSSTAPSAWGTAVAASSRARCRSAAATAAPAASPAG